MYSFFIEKILKIKTLSKVMRPKTALQFQSGHNLPRKAQLQIKFVMTNRRKMKLMYYIGESPKVNISPPRPEMKSINESLKLSSEKLEL